MTFEWRPISPDDAVQQCAEALGEDAPIILEELRAGQSHAATCDQGTIITRSEPGEFVIVAYQGEQGREVYRHICAKAFDVWGFPSVRFHSKRPGMRRYVGDLADEIETVFRTRA